MGQSKSNHRDRPNLWRATVSAFIIGFDIDQQSNEVLVKHEFDWYVTNQADFDEEFDWEVTSTVTKRNDPAWGPVTPKKYVQGVELAVDQTKRYPDALNEFYATFEAEPGTYDVIAYCRVEVFRPIGAGRRQNLEGVKTLPEPTWSFTIE